jgi:hypothetical protein
MNVIVKLAVKSCLESQDCIHMPICPIQIRLGLFLTRSLFFPCQSCYHPSGVTDPVTVTYSLSISSCPNTLNSSVVQYGLLLLLVRCLHMPIQRHIQSPECISRTKNGKYYSFLPLGAIVLLSSESV